jgi:hypothetical protein
MLDLILFLKTTPLFRSVPLEDIARVARLAEPVSKDQGETIAEAQDPVRHVYVVRNGAIELRLNDMAVEIAGPGASIGECAVFGEERHAVPFARRRPHCCCVSQSASLPISSPRIRKCSGPWHSICRPASTASAPGWRRNRCDAGWAPD